MPSIVKILFQMASEILRNSLVRFSWETKKETFFLSLVNTNREWRRLAHQLTIFLLSLPEPADADDDDEDDDHSGDRSHNAVDSRLTDGG